MTFETDSKIGALADAAAVAAEQRQQAEGVLAQARDRAAREAEASWARERVAEIEQAVNAYAAAAQPLIDALHQVRNFHANRLALLVQQSYEQLREADVSGVGALVRDLKRYGIDLLAGRVGIEKKLPPEDAKAA